MKYKTIEIRRAVNGRLYFSGVMADGKDRIKGKKCIPNAMGFYHYWETIQDQIAFEALKQSMLNSIHDQINALLEDAEDLGSMTMKRNIVEASKMKSRKKA